MPLSTTRARASVRAASQPREPRAGVGIYACGPTVYGRIHVGNARPFVVFSLLKRFLEHAGYEVTLVVNVTDVNDKIYDAARAAGRSSVELAAAMTAAYIADTDRLGARAAPTTSRSPASRSSAIVAEIEALIANGPRLRAPAATSTSACARDHDYGALSRRDRRRDGPGRGRRGRDRKEDPLDFALWKAHKAGEDSAWDAPWGRGRPGWHIECSAMAEDAARRRLRHPRRRLDLLFPHHENEAAQTRCARGEELARDLDAQRHAPATTARRCRSRSATSRRCTRCLSSTAAMRSSSTSSAATTASRWRSPRRRWSKPAASVQRIREAGRRRSQLPSRRRVRQRDVTCDRCATASSTRSPRLQHARGAGRAAGVDSRGHEPDAGSGGRLSTCARCSACWGSENLLGDRPRRPRQCGSWPAGASRRGRRRDFARADELREQIEAARLGGPRRAGGFELLPRVIVYGRNAVREALRGRRAHASARSSPPRRAAREPWLEGREGARRHRRGARAGAAARTSTRASARRRAATRTSRPRSCSACRSR